MPCIQKKIEAGFRKAVNHGLDVLSGQEEDRFNSLEVLEPDCSSLGLTEFV